MSRVWLDGRVLEAGEAHIDPADRGFLLGDGAFETMRLEVGAIRRWDRHCARLASALKLLEIAPPDWAEIERAARRLAQDDGLEEAVVRLTVSRGPRGRGFAMSAGEPGTVLVSVSAHPGPLTPPSLVTIDAPRREPTSLSARFKSLGYADALHARRRALARGGDMAVMLSSAGAPACADCANLIWITGREAFTPALSTGAMPGTTRAALLEAAADEGLRLREGVFDRAALNQAEAVAVTNAVIGAAPCAALDGRALNTDHPLLEALARLERHAR